MPQMRGARHDVEALQPRYALRSCACMMRERGKMRDVECPMPVALMLRR